jgi:threonine/homoserine/homoserine lactone efflux protein
LVFTGKANFLRPTTLIAGFTIALAFAAPPGPVAMETIRHGMRGGFWSALRVQLGSILGDLAWCALALFGLAPIFQADWIRLPVAAIGAIVLLALGGAVFRDAIRGSEALFREDTGKSGGSFRIGAAISLGNPMAPALWISVGGTMTAAGIGQNVQRRHLDWGCKVAVLELSRRRFSTSVERTLCIADCDRYPGDFHGPGGDVDDEQDVIADEPEQGHGFHGKEIHRCDGSEMRLDKFCPRQNGDAVRGLSANPIVVVGSGLEELQDLTIPLKSL